VHSPAEDLTERRAPTPSKVETEFTALPEALRREDRFEPQPSAARASRHLRDPPWRRPATSQPIAFTAAIACSDDPPVVNTSSMITTHHPP
jgi:hypothetical protein